MSEGDKSGTTIIVVKKGGHHDGHHGGAWKVAMADFAIAMMAFFLLMWLLSSTTQEEKEAISGYFEDPGKVSLDTDAPPTLIIMDQDPRVEKDKLLRCAEIGIMESQQNQQILETGERKKMEVLLEEVRHKIEEDSVLNEYKDQIRLDLTDEGLRVQIIDKENQPMFDSSSSMMNPFATAILKELSAVLNKVDNRISISGHTDTTQFTNAEQSNWELSTERANSARRALIDGGLEENKVARVVGLSSTVLYDKEDPASPSNRRISIVVLKKTYDDPEFSEHPPGATPTPPNEEGLPTEEVPTNEEGLSTEEVPSGESESMGSPEGSETPLPEGEAGSEMPPEGGEGGVPPSEGEPALPPAVEAPAVQDGSEIPAETGESTAPGEPGEAEQAAPPSEPPP